MLFPQAGGPTQSQLSSPVSSRHRMSMEHRLQWKHLLVNPDTNATKEKQIKKNILKKKKKKKKEKAKAKEKEKEKAKGKGKGK